jgi:hypothetical protein
MEEINKYFDTAKTTHSDIWQHMDKLREYAEKCDHITEMGVRTVVSTWAFLAAKPKRLVSYDIVDCPVDDVRRLAAANGISFEFIKTSTIDPSLDIEETDLLFIDTDHTYRQLSQELDQHAHKARKYIALHDTVTFRDECCGEEGLWRAVQELINTGDWIMCEHFSHCNGMTFLERVSD